jgi:putative ABC transport system substrate-binding protein
VGWLFPGPAGGVPPRVVAFKDGLLQLGFQSPKQVDVVTRIADSNHARLEPMARELLALNVDVIAAFSPSAINALLKVVKETGHKVPIVAMSLVSDPVDSGWVKSLAQPGGNVTGLFLDFPEFSKKWLELLKEMIPGLTKVAVFWDPPTGTMQRAGVEQAARILNVELDIMTVRRLADLDDRFVAARRGGAGAVLLLASPLFGGSLKLVADLSLKHRMPVVSPFPAYSRVGGLMGYGPNLLDTHRQVGTIVGKILMGKKPADLPVERHSRFEMAVNLKTAKVLGVTVPTSVLLRADDVIE